MNPERWKKIEEIYCAVVEKTSDEREEFLQKSCNGDDELRRKVESLLNEEDSAGGFIESAVKGVAQKFLDKDELEIQTGKTIGKYRIVGKIGRGGMGSVFLAERKGKDFKQKVAVKIIRRGMDTADILRRFRTERKILASLEHANIARLIDGGASRDGLPYFVMEYIEGEPILQYCDSRRLSTSERLKLFREVCAAVSFAHQNLVVHRDIKPSNILVTKDGNVKLLDFGIAKVLKSDENGSALFETETAFRLMTPEYASPEQVRGEQVTTSTDIYSLGVILFELLTGHRPYQIKNRTPQELLKIVCESEPERPSTVITHAEEIFDKDKTGYTLTPETVSKTRGTRPDTLRRQLQGDLDNVILKALHKETSRRYSSVEQFSEDIRRHLEGLPVIARPDTFFYRTGKFIGRHRVVAAFASLLIVTILGFSATAWIQSNRVARERDRAERISLFLTEIFRSANPNEAKGKELTVRELLDKGAERVRNELKDQPEMQAKLLLTMAQSYQALSVFEKAEELGEEAVRVNRRLYGDENPETLAAKDFLAEVKIWSKKPEEALAMFREIVATRKRLFGDTFETAKSINRLAFLLAVTDEAEANYREALATARRVLPPDDPRLLEFLTDTATFLWENRFNLLESESLAREAVTLAEKHADENPLGLLRAQNCLARVYVGAGKYDEAAELSLRVLEIHKQLYSVENQARSNVMQNLGQAYSLKGDLEKAEPLLIQAFEIRKKINSPLIIYSYYELGVLRFKQGRLAEAEEHFRHLETHTDFRLRNKYAELFMTKGEFEKAEIMLRENSSKLLERYGAAHPDYAISIGLLGECLSRQNRKAEAAPLLRESYEILLKILGENHPHTIEAKNRLSSSGV